MAKSRAVPAWSRAAACPKATALAIWPTADTAAFPSASRVGTGPVTRSSRITAAARKIARDARSCASARSVPRAKSVLACAVVVERSLRRTLRADGRGRQSRPERGLRRLAATLTWGTLLSCFAHVERRSRFDLSRRSLRMKSDGLAASFVRFERNRHVRPCFVIQFERRNRFDLPFVHDARRRICIWSSRWTSRLLARSNMVRPLLLCPRCSKSFFATWAFNNPIAGASQTVASSALASHPRGVSPPRTAVRWEH